MTTVRTRAGLIEGGPGQRVLSFRGVPYAQADRFDRPGPVGSWSGVRSAREAAPVSPQAGARHPVLQSWTAVPAAGWSEDCLYLDVATPACDSGRRPVMVWIHGGGFSRGAGSFWVYDGEDLAARGDVVVVCINYRLGAFGNLDLRSLTPDAEPNLGLRDQIAALEWVRDHIEAFGGDPTNVTLFGQSAGAMSITCLMAAPAARGLFHKAILQSGAGRNWHGDADAAGVAEALVRTLDLDPDRQGLLDAMRKKSAAELLRAQLHVAQHQRLPLGMLAWQPVLDGELLPVDPLEAIEGGQSAPMPILVGTNREEWKMFTATDAKRRRLDAATLRSYLERTLDRDGVGDRLAVDDVLAHYGADPWTGANRTPADVWVAFQGDRVFHEPAIRLADAHGRAGGRAFFYRFDRGPRWLADRVGACHSIELPFVFGTLRQPLLRAAFGWSSDALEIAAAVQDAWADFARSGDPGGGWPAYAPGAGQARIFGGASETLEAQPESLRRFAERLRPAPPASTHEARA